MDTKAGGGSVAAVSSTPAAPETDTVQPLLKPWSGDLPEMLERRVIRALVPWSDSYYFLDGVQQSGIAFEATQILEKWLNEELESGTLSIRIVVLPVRRDQLLSFLADGYGDVALGGITVTPQRLESVNFTDPTSKPISEVIVSAPDAPYLENLDDLSGREVHVRRSSSYWDSLQALNADLASRSLDPVTVVPADEYLSTEDLMQMAHAGLIPYTVADDAIAHYWSQALPGLRVRDDLPVRSGAHVAMAIRKDSPKLEELLNRFIAGHKQGSLMGNIVVNRYLKDPRRLHNIHSGEDRARMESVIGYFRAHAPEYEFDTLMMVAQGFQESRLDQSRRSDRGAVGVMQLLPSTAADPAVGIDDISSAENNILAGIRYMAHIRETYLDDPAIDDLNRTLLAFASYNAGPNRVRTLRATAAERGLDPNKWFGSVELIAAEVIGRETVEYVSNIYKYYLAYRLAENLDHPRTSVLEPEPGR